MKDYVTLSIETHLFFARIMKEHALFLEAGFPCCEKDCIEQAQYYRRKFEGLLKGVLTIADGNIREPILKSCELATEFTIPAERRTEALSGISIDSRITEETRKLTCGRPGEDCALEQKVTQINEEALKLLNGLICFQERILGEMKEGRLFTANYPLLLEHITREAELYCDLIKLLMNNRQISCEKLYETECFWNRIMMEHALFIRGLLDPSETELIKTADAFSRSYSRLLEAACQRSGQAEELTKKTLKETFEYRNFKAAGTEGILNCEISSILLPLLADHVLREANHYIRMMETGRTR